MLLKYSDISHLISQVWCKNPSSQISLKVHTTESKHGVLSDRWVTHYRLKAAFVHELNGWTEKVCQCAQFLIHRATITQLLFLAN